MFEKEDIKALMDTDAEFCDIFTNFAAEAEEQSRLDKKTAATLVLASLTARQVADARYKAAVNAALAAGVTPAEIKEAVYQCAPYCGAAAVWSALEFINGVFADKGLAAETSVNRAVNSDTRFTLGLQTQKGIFGDVIDKNRADAPTDQKHIQDFLSKNCFGDYYTRKSLGAKLRELITFTVLITIGGCEPQVKGHVAGNLAVGNDKSTLIGVVTLLVPYIGYPRTLNALACVNAVCG